ncbi:hypothetical protein GWI33_012000 [Rhynchophorus ferrugineus]|uniref:Uncharacterized protein n=1 Tax=Rhynchophorus ferrugineus TaxID=354439 RepID=A0A834MN61_RHYFE|nr:hypothetical protein GWI33_012000 [Rhynchophorus ferrugineus]
MQPRSEMDERIQQKQRKGKGGKNEINTRKKITDRKIVRADFRALKLDGFMLSNRLKYDPSKPKLKHGTLAILKTCHYSFKSDVLTGIQARCVRKDHTVLQSAPLTVNRVNYKGRGSFWKTL